MWTVYCWEDGEELIIAQYDCESHAALTTRYLRRIMDDLGYFYYRA